MTKHILRKSTLALILVLLTSSISKTFAQSVPGLPPSLHPTATLDKLVPRKIVLIALDVIARIG